ncbi:MAG TPA: beta-ketoacyl-ACP synthase 3 [Bacillota bacterium]|nr:beta-ketoacyl-ACP synthase 3 [Bacillota bacterium]
MKEVGIRSISSYSPEHKLTNADLEKMVDTTDEWIVTRTGISERRIAKDISTSGMAIKAAKKAVDQAGIPIEDYAFTISSTVTPELSCPAQACLVGQSVGLTNGFCFDLNAACSGMLYTMAIGADQLKLHQGKAGLITASEKMSVMLDYTDRASCILFGDGASAMVLTTEPPYHKILHYELGADPSGAHFVQMGGRENHGNEEMRNFRQDGRAVFRFAVTKLKALLISLKEKAGVGPEDRFFVIPHQANLRMIENVAKDLDISMDHFVMNIQTHGNTSSASIGLAMAEATEQGLFQSGDKLLLAGFGGGLTWGAAIIEW